MIVQIPDFANKEDLFTYLKANKSRMIAQKKQFDTYSEVCKAGVSYIHADGAVKGLPATADGEIAVKVVMNTTNLIDSHMDMHVKGIWNKTLSEHESFYHLQEHKASFTTIVDAEAKAYVQTMTWKEMGLNYEGLTEALIFESKVKKSENETMYNAYADRKVKNHSVCMRYIKFEMAINSTDKAYAEEKAVWDEWFPLAANKEVAESRGYFWVVKEAKLNEGSAVVFGSNHATPTLATSKEDTATEPEDHSEQPTKSLIVELAKSLKP